MYLKLVTCKEAIKIVPMDIEAGIILIHQLIYSLPTGLLVCCWNDCTTIGLGTFVQPKSVVLKISVQGHWQHFQCRGQLWNPQNPPYCHQEELPWHACNSCLHFHTRPHVSHAVQDMLQSVCCKMFDHLLYSPDPSLCDFHMFSPLK